MGKHKRRAHFLKIRLLYLKASKQVILEEFSAVCEHHRKYAIRQLAQKTSKLH